MYLGRVVEEGPADQVVDDPKHPYTRALLAAAPDLAERRGRNTPALGGDMPNPIDPPSGVFHPPLSGSHGRLPGAGPPSYDAGARTLRRLPSVSRLGVAAGDRHR